jgi:hypothetical protein
VLQKKTKVLRLSLSPSLVVGKKKKTKERKKRQNASDSSAHTKKFDGQKMLLWRYETTTTTGIVLRSGV